jgi:para-nitrobenzyl esterase
MTAHTLAEAEADGMKFAQSKGVHSLAELRALTWQKLLEPVRDSQTPAKAGGMPSLPRFMPIIDGYCLTAAEEQIIVQGKQNDVVILTGYNSGEIDGSMMGGPQEPLTAESYAKQARQSYGNMADEFLQLYPAATDEQAKTAKVRSERDRTLASMYLWARLRAKTSKTKAFLYLWDHTLPGPEAQKWGAFHTAEIPYVMNTLTNMPGRPFAETDRSIADMMSSYWANFIATGDPNGKGLAPWPAVGSKPEVMEVGDHNQPVSVTGSSVKFAFFEKYFSRQDAGGAKK